MSAFTLGALCACAFLVFFSSLLASTFLSAARANLASLGAFVTAAVSIVGVAAAGLAAGCATGAAVAATS